jgi:hypothetical protein
MKCSQAGETATSRVRHRCPRRSVPARQASWLDRLGRPASRFHRRDASWLGRPGHGERPTILAELIIELIPVPDLGATAGDRPGAAA